MERRYTIVMVPELEDGGYSVLVPTLPGCVTHGRDVDQCVARAREAIAGYIESLEKHGDVVPEEREAPRTIVIDVAA